MAKKFTDPERWAPWYRAMKPGYRFFWDFINDHCDLIGIWKVDIATAEFMIGCTLDPAEALTLFGPRVRVVAPDAWYLTGFIAWQYGELRTSNNFHRSLRVALAHFSISDFWGSPAPHQPQTSPSPAPQCPSGTIRQTLLKTNVNVNTKSTTKHLDKDFIKLWERYPKKLGRKAAERHFNASVKTDQDWLDIQNALDNYIARIKKEGIADAYIQHGSTWFFNWQDDISYRGPTLPKVPPPPPKAVEPPPPDYSQEEIDQFHRDTVAKLGSCWTKDCRVCAGVAR